MKEIYPASAPEGLLTLWRVWAFLTGCEEATITQAWWGGFLAWPPDVFALCASVVRRSGCYTTAFANGSCPQAPSVRDAARAWRGWFAEQPSAGRSAQGRAVPEVIAEPWEAILSGRFVSLSHIVEYPVLMRNLLFLMAAADEVCAGSGLPYQAVPDKKLGWTLEQKGEWRLIWRGWERLQPTRRGSTLCSERIHPNAARVLPKAHVAAAGLTIRSFSHHLALCESDEVQPRWFMIPGARGDEGNERHVNLVVLPWPLEIAPSQFESISNSKSGLRYFNFRSRPIEALTEVVGSICDEAQRLLGSVDAVVMPELALHHDEYEAVRRVVLARKLLLIAGVGRNGDGDRRGVNEVCIDVPLSQYHAVHFRQAKHHRWKLDRDQIVTYGIGSRLDHTEPYWENIEIGDRRLLFLVLRPWFVASVLICEDLARHDPVGELLRGVGPHMVAALLMDGPQLEQRWPSRYAAVLADDPGSSVLSVSSLGMVSLAKRKPSDEPSRVVALWKDSRQGAVELALPKGARGLAVTISVETSPEWTSDLRDFSAQRPVLTGVHELKGEPRPDGATIAQDNQVRFLAPNEAVDLARLAQQLKSPDASPEVLMELAGEARAIGLEIWRLSAQWPSKEQVSAALDKRRQEHDPLFQTAVEAETRHTVTAAAICHWCEKNLREQLKAPPRTRTKIRRRRT